LRLADATGFGDRQMATAGRPGPFSLVGLTDAEDPTVLRHYEGLVFRTAQLTCPLVDDDFDDVQQQLRIAVWKALLAWDPGRRVTTRDRYVFTCLKNRQKDLIKRRRRGEVSIEQLTVRETDNGQLKTRDSFDLEHLAAGPDEVYRQVEEQPPLVPSTLTGPELRVLCLLYADYRHAEVAVELGLTKRDVERTVRQIRVKMADWQPATSAVPAGSYPRTAVAA
jgi:RNA polymerase sigma factor (sigma-70 family)